VNRGRQIHTLNPELVIKIVTIYQRDRTKGRRQIKMRLWRKYNIQLALGTVHRYMSILGLYSIQRKKRYKNAPLEKSDNALQNVLRRNFKSTHPNQKWVTDITYMRCREGNLYLSCIKDLYDNSIIAYHISNKNDLDLVIQTLNNAFSENNPETLSGLIIHSDRGSQYISKIYDETLRLYGIIPSYSRKSTPTDNAPIESFYAIFKQECFKQIKQKFQYLVKQTVASFIHEYNHERPQWNKKELTPIEYRYQFNS
jgi:putative transposase